MAWWRREREVFDPHELGARRSDPELAALEPLPPDPRKISTRNLLLYFVIGVVVIAMIRDGVGRGAPAVKGSCTKPAFVLDKTEVKTNGVLQWSAAGPADSSVVFGVDTSAVPSTTGRLAGPIGLRDCRAHGRFGVPVPEGAHVVTAYLVAADGTSSVIGTQRIEVDEP